MRIKLDRALGNGSWVKTYEAAHAYFPEYDISDHCSIIKSWCANVGDMKFSFRVVAILKLLKSHLKLLDKYATSIIGQRVFEGRNELLDLQRMLRNTFTDELKGGVDRCTRKLKRLVAVEEWFLKQQTKVNWYHGNKGSRYFYALIDGRRRGL
ncbi:hypothetical protein Droror1_Dr00027029 [Drosera rotundifolia]